MATALVGGDQESGVTRKEVISAKGLSFERQLKMKDGV